MTPIPFVLSSPARIFRRDRTRRPGDRQLTCWWLALVCSLGLLDAGQLSADDEPAKEGLDAVERVIWRKEPIRLKLTVGQERRIDFPAAVQVGVPAGIQPRLRTQSVNGSVYLQAHAPFGPHRVLVRESRPGRIYLVDLVAVDDEPVHRPTVEIHLPDVSQPDPADEQVSSGPGRGLAEYRRLTRFAAQQLYAPARLIGERLGLVRVPLSRQPRKLYRGGAVQATPWVAWRAGGLYVTAVKLTNRTSQGQPLDPRWLRGRWLAATFQHGRLLPAGEEADTSAVYLVSSRPFDLARHTFP